MSKLLYPLFELGNFNLGGRVTVKITGYTPLSQKSRTIEMECSEHALKILARVIRDRMRELRDERTRQNARNLSIFNDS